MTYPDPATLASIERCTESGHPCGCTQTRRPSGAPHWRLCSYHEGYNDGTERGLDDERALHIGRAVLSCNEVEVDDDIYVQWPNGDETLWACDWRVELIATGEETP